MVAALMFSAPVGAAPPPPEPLDVDGGSSLVPVPAGCAPLEAADVVFVGTVVGKDAYIEKGTVRYQIDQLRAGNATPYSVDGLVDVRYGPDSKYLDVGEQYLVGASVDPAIGVLASKVTPEKPLFGGDSVIGLEDTTVVCPEFDDPVMTLETDGSAVESGVLTPMFEDRRVLLAAFAIPAAIAGLVLVGLVIVRRMWGWGFRGVLELGRAAVTPQPDHVATRVRQHGEDAQTQSSVDATSVFGVWRGPNTTDDELVGSSKR